MQSSSSGAIGNLYMYLGAARSELLKSSPLFGRLCSARRNPIIGVEAVVLLSTSDSFGQESNPVGKHVIFSLGAITPSTGPVSIVDRFLALSLPPTSPTRRIPLSILLPL